MRRKLIVGNWKMYGSRPANAELLAALLAARPFAADVAVCVPALFISETAATLAGSDLRWGAQDVSAQAEGAYTGEIGAAMLHEAGCRYAIVGHSERRAYHAETDQLVAQKAQAALARGVTPIVCVGETLAEREAGATEDVVKRQLSAVIHQLAHCAAEMVVAYEPVWAIGTGRAATADDAQETIAVIRATVADLVGQAAADELRIQYGGSVKSSNAEELATKPDVDGALVGGASLDADEFAMIIKGSARRAR